jgi:hypothetical protein
VKTITTMLLLLAFCASCFATGSDCWGLGDGWTCYDRMQLQAEAASGNALVVNNSSGTAKWTVDYAGASTIENDVTLKGDGTDLLFHTANQNTIGAATKGAKVIYTRAVTNETSTALTITGASGIGLVGATTITGALVPEADSTRDLGAAATAFRTLYVDEVQGTTSTAVSLKEGATLPSGKDILPAADGTSDLGSATVRFAELHVDSLFVSPPATATTTSNMTAFVTIADTTGLSGLITLTLPDAATNSGRIMGLVLLESTTQDVEVKSAGGTIGLSDRSAAAAAATGVTFTDADEDKDAFWQSNGTNWVLLWGSATVD